MIFNSLEFLVFFPVVFALYWALQNRLNLQNLFLLVASYVFYGWWDWRFLALIAFSSVLDFGIGREMGRSTETRTRRLLLATSLTVNLGLLGVFKYFNFFADSFADLLGVFGVNASWTTLSIVLPVGISFYTFQTLSYTIDVYRRDIEPTKHLLTFMAYVSFFPQLVAGPIERAASLLPQFERPREFDERRAVDGLRQILWGLFKKVAVADTAGLLVDEVFANYSTFSGATLALAAFFFAIQIYGDFSGYSDIAIGTGRLLGVDLMRNFAYPYFSRDIAEFWRRWHISLSSWFRDYLYIPLGGSRVSRGMALRNILIIFVVSGFWHGANWTFVVWGALNALYFVPAFLAGQNRVHVGPIAEGRLLPSPREAWGIAKTFALTVLAWILFRSDTISDAASFLVHMVTHPTDGALRISTSGFLLAGIMLAVEWIHREREHGLAIDDRKPWVRRTAYLALIGLIVSYAGAERPFIYFQF